MESAAAPTPDPIRSSETITPKTYQTGTLRYGALIPGNYLTGEFMDLVQSDYRMTFLWSAILFVLAIYPMLLVHREWKKRGGRKHYVPPAPR